VQRALGEDLMNRFHMATLVILLIGNLVGCTSTPQAPPPATTAADAASSVRTPGTPGMPSSVPSSAAATVALAPHLDPSSPISKERSVYFDYDDFSIKSEYAGLVERQGRYLAAHPTLAVKIEGNADERGSAEYNLALGQKRAEAVLKALKIYGAKDTQLEAVSWGKERPKAVGHDESAWAQNRRADLVYPRQ
jgi:peptidoglycan-associated lipoprotein